MAALIREAVDRVLPTDDTPDSDELWQRAMRAVKAAVRGGSRDVSTEHDRYLDESYLPEPHP